MAYIDLDLAQVKAVSKAQECTINDVLISVVAAALREYLCFQTSQPGHNELRGRDANQSFDINKAQIHAVVPFRYSSLLLPPPPTTTKLEEKLSVFLS